MKHEHIFPLPLMH